MATTVPVFEFVKAVEAIRKTYPVTYKNGFSGTKSGDTYLCDCRGLIIWALRRLGVDYSCTGTNWMIRRHMAEIHPVTSADQLQVGQLVFKSRTDTSKLPDRYRRGGSAYDDRFGELDVYHVGIVTQVSPLAIRHCTSGGIKTDTALGKWCWAGWHEKTTTDKATPAEVAVVTAPTGSTVNLRRDPTKGSPIITRIPINSTVAIVSRGSDWHKVTYLGKTGYMMAEFLRDRG